MEIALVVIFWFVVALVVGSAARSRGRSGAAWFLLSGFVLSPLIGILLLLVLPNRAVVIPRDPSGEVISSKTHVRCPDCREPVRHDAIKCRHCGATLEPQPAAEISSNWISLVLLIAGMIVLAVLFK